MSSNVNGPGTIRAFEAYFFRQMLASVPLGPSGQATFQDILRDSLAEKIAETEPLGLAGLFPSGFSTSTPIPPSVIQAGARAYSAAGTLSSMPVAGTLSSSFGPRSDPLSAESRHHAGVDIAAPAGAPVACAGPGRVVRAEEAGGYGQLVVVDHGDGLETRYAHLGGIAVHVGQEVAAGARLGEVGTTGRTTGPHLHFEVRRGGRPVKPESELPALKMAFRWPIRSSESP